EGGTAFVLSDKNSVVSLDINRVRLKRQDQKFGKNNFSRPNSDDSNKILPADEILEQFHSVKIKKVNGSALVLPFAANSFDIIILQDVIEHIEQTQIIIEEIHRVLKPQGVLYLSTPNKLSVFNIISDPHWGMPFLSLLNRQKIKNFYLKRFRKIEMHRTDIAELLSLNDLLKFFSNFFQVRLFTTYTVKELLNGNKGIVWSDFHLSLMKIIKKTRIDRVLISAANDKFGIINKYLTPTFYMVLIKQ
ncbi:MAG TPA: class I SAM-dependent methyltransferase, partial [Ignavibacteriaceae bacterium]|nr:class I SAM-dependent methyltransferase [Ignavibacteriaceae bacterium]